MTPETPSPSAMRESRWRRIEALFHEASAMPPADRPAFLATACAGDDALRHDVESLLAESASDDGFLAEPVMPAEAISNLTRAAMAGRSLGGYRLQTLLGVGGMGEVYRARDVKLGRDVAIKILPPAFTRTPDRLARFEREARMLAALNHPNICAIYGFEEADGVSYLILELVEGDTLAEVLTRAAGPGVVSGLPIVQALPIARQIVEAFEVAHDKGIVHRDLKPANIKITPDGIVKVLDFGLAKTVGGEGPSPDLTQAPTAGAGEPAPGAVVGTAAYMSPEQARGLPVDKRTDIWAFGCVLYEMLTGRRAFGAHTVSDSIARILEREPDWSALPADTPAPIRRILARCLVKDSKQRLRDIGDVRIEIDAIDDERPVPPAATRSFVPRVRVRTWLPWAALALLAAVVGILEVRRAGVVDENPLANARFSRVTNWEGTEELAEISPDGRFVAFLADRDGQFDVWVSQLGSASFYNLTPKLPPLLSPGNLLRTLGFTSDGSEIWLSPGSAGAQKVLMPMTGGTPRAFLGRTDAAPSWSSDGARLAYFDATNPAMPGDPMFIADRTGADAHPIIVPAEGAHAFFRRDMHNHNPVWSPDSEWIYFARGSEPTGDMDVWRMRPSGEQAEQLTHQNAPVNFLAPIDARTLLYVARAQDWSGPWLWALDVERKVTRRVTAGLEQYASVSISRDGRRIVATVARPTASLWSVPLLDRVVEDRDAEPYPMPAERALAPRFGGASLFYLSLASSGTGDGLWRVQGDQAVELRRGADGVVSEPPAASPDGSRVAVIIRQQGKRRLAIMSADGTSSRTVAAGIEIQGAAGRAIADWSPDGKWIAAAGSDAEGRGLFMIPADGTGAPVRLVTGQADNPVWAPGGDLIVYAAPFVGGLDVLRGVRPDGSEVAMPEVRVRQGGAHRFLRSGLGLVYLPSTDTKDFWLLDLATHTTRQLTRLSDRGYLNIFDITPDGTRLVFDRSRQNADVVLIELQKR